MCNRQHSTETLLSFTEENEVRTMVDPNSRNDPKLQELMKVRISKDRFWETFPQETPGLGRSHEVTKQRPL